MQKNKRGKLRIIEVWTGIILLLSTLSILFSYLFNFEFSSPDHSLADDFMFLSDNVSQQKASSISWMITASLYIILIPLYLIVFYRDQPLIHILNSLIITVMAGMFFRASLAGFALHKIVESIPADQVVQPEPQVLSYIKDMIQLTMLGLTTFGAYVFLLSISRFRRARFIIFGRVLLFLSGPLIAIFTWIDPEHILFNTALAAASVGLFIAGVKFVNKGMVKSVLKTLNHEEDVSIM